MKTVAKTKPTRAARRNLFAELGEGMTALAEARSGKRTLRTHAIEYKPAPKVTPKELIHEYGEIDYPSPLRHRHPKVTGADSGAATHSRRASDDVINQGAGRFPGTVRLDRPVETSAHGVVLIAYFGDVPDIGLCYRAIFQGL